jgi:hypothetical protein
MKTPATHPPSAWQLQEALRVLMEGITSMGGRLADDDLTERTLGELWASADANGAISVLEAVLRASVHAGDMAELAAQRAKLVAERGRRYEERQQKLRDMARDAFYALGVSRHEMPDMTVSVRGSMPCVKVIDLGAIPNHFKHCEERMTVDKVALAKALKNGEQVPGVELSNGAPTISIRTV